ncbi:MAG: hypothetical protein AB1424_18810 [Thermodesulfobacteriota bacterium]
MESASVDDLLNKVRLVAQGPDGGLLKKFVDLLYERQEEYDTEPLSPECLSALEELEAAVKRGDRSRFISQEEFERRHGL